MQISKQPKHFQEVQDSFGVSLHSMDGQKSMSFFTLLIIFLKGFLSVVVNNEMKGFTNHISQGFSVSCCEHNLTMTGFLKGAANG